MSFIGNLVAITNQLDVLHTNIIGRRRYSSLASTLNQREDQSDLMASAEERQEIRRIRLDSEFPIRVLYLDGISSHIRSIEGLRDLGVSKVEQLSMVNMRLTGLTTVPRMPRLRALDLSDNRITGNLQRLHVCPQLTYLNLSRNQIKNIEALYPLKMLGCLQSLDLFGNAVIFVDNYRQKVFNLINTLRYLDGSIKEVEEE